MHIFIFSKYSSEFILTWISCGFAIVAIIEPLNGIPLFAIIVIEFLWQYFHPKSSLTVTFDKVHECPTVIDQTASILLNEWPSPVGNHGEPERNFVRTASLYESNDNFPCHLIAYTNDKEVVAHACLLLSPNSDSKDYKKYFKMIKNGVPLAAVKNSAKLAGLDTAFLADPLILQRTPEPPMQNQREGYLTSVVVKPEYRGYGLGKAICAHAVLVAIELGVTRLVGGCRDGVLPFYQKMGVCRMSTPKREDMPSIRLGNYMYLELNSEVLKKANGLIAKFVL